MKRLIAAFVLSATSAASQAVTLIYDREFSQPPGTVQPSGNVVMEYTNTIDGVQIDIDMTGLTGTEYLAELYLNDSDGILNLTGVSSTTPALTNWTSGVDSFKADGDGYYDYLLQFDSTDSNRLEAGDTATLVLQGLALSDLAALSTGSSQSYLSAIHLRSIDIGGSGWFEPRVGIDPFLEPNVVPIPAAAWMFLGGLGLFRAMRGKKA